MLGELTEAHFKEQDSVNLSQKQIFPPVSKIVFVPCLLIYSHAYGIFEKVVSFKFYKEKNYTC